MAGVASRFEISILGDKDLEVALRALPAKVERRLLRSSLRNAFKRTLEAARAAVPVEMGALKRSMKLRAGNSTRNFLQFRIFTGDIATLAGLGARRTRPPSTTENRHGRIIARGLGARGARREGYYPAAVELGYVRRTKSGGVHVPPRSFLRSALKATTDDVIKDVAADLWEGIRDESGLLPGGKGL